MQVIVMTNSVSMCLMVNLHRIQCYHMFERKNWLVSSGPNISFLLVGRFVKLLATKPL